MSLSEFRKEIDVIDAKLIRLFAKRLKVVQKVAKYKEKEGIPVLDKKRENVVFKKISRISKLEGLDPNVVKKIYSLFINYCKKIERAHIQKN